MKNTIIYYTSKEECSSELHKSIEQFANSNTIQCNLINKWFEESTQMDFMLDVHNELVVIVDCTIPHDLSKPTIYPILTAHINMLDHVLAYSNNYYEDGTQILPLNIVPVRKRTKDDNDLVLWLKTQIKDIVNHAGYYDRLSLINMDYLTLKENKSKMEEMWQTSMKLKKNREINASQPKKVMISYRNSHSKEVEEFKEIIESNINECAEIRRNIGLSDDEYKITALPPASLCGANEAHTPMRKWMLVGLLEDYLRDIDEVWVYLTEDYTQSWWTLAEIVMTYNINYAISDSEKKKIIRVYDPHNNKFLNKEDYPNFLNFTITEEQHKKIARYLSNTRPDTMGPEMISNAKKLSQLAVIMRNGGESFRDELINNIRETLSLSIPNDIPEDERETMISEMLAMYSNPDELEKYAKDEVFQKEFWNNISYQIDATTPAFVNNIIDVDLFMATPMLELTNYSQKDLEARYKKNENIRIINDKEEKNYRIDKGITRYLWHATRMGKPTIKDAPGIETIQTYDLYSPYSYDSEITITLFSSNSEEGKILKDTLCKGNNYHVSLKELVFQTLQKFGKHENNINILTPNSIDMEMEFMYAQLYSDIVIFDGSLEEDGIELGSNYACVSHAPYLLDNVIVVSRSTLPINFVVNKDQTNVYPIGEEPIIGEEKLINGTKNTIYKKRYSNDEIIIWIETYIKNLVKDGRFPRNQGYKKSREDIISKNPFKVIDDLNNIAAKTNKYKKNEYKRTAFISYRSCYNERSRNSKKSNGFSVQDLEQIIKEYHPNEKWNVLYYPEGSLAQDCMTEYRRWGLINYIDNIFKQVDEVWIFNTHDINYGPSYWDSWFTQGEFISLMELKQNLPSHCPKVIMFDPSKTSGRDNIKINAITIDKFISDGAIKEITKDLPVIDKDLSTYLSQMCVNTDLVYGDMAGYLKACNEKVEWSDYSWIKRGFYNLLSMILLSMSRKKFLSHRSFDKDFRFNRICTCPDCLKKNFSMESFKEREFIKGFIDIYSPNKSEQKCNESRGYFTINDEEFLEYYKNGNIVKCPNCDKKFKIVKNENMYIYIWTRKIGDNINHKYIEKLESYDLVEDTSKKI